MGYWWCLLGLLCFKCMEQAHQQQLRMLTHRQVLHFTHISRRLEHAKTHPHRTQHWNKNNPTRQNLSTWDSCPRVEIEVLGSKKKQRDKRQLGEWESVPVATHSDALHWFLRWEQVTFVFSVEQTDLCVHHGFVLASSWRRWHIRAKQVTHYICLCVISTPTVKIIAVNWN